MALVLAATELPLQVLPRTCLAKLSHPNNCVVTACGADGVLCSDGQLHGNDMSREDLPVSQASWRPVAS